MGCVYYQSALKTLAVFYNNIIDPVKEHSRHLRAS